LFGEQDSYSELSAQFWGGQFWKGRFLTLRFTDTGPEFPSALIDALMAGEVVFLCGTGVSAPQLPEFGSLVDKTFQRLGVEMDSSERRSYEAQRFEEVLGSLGRRLADPDAMVRAASELLAVPADPSLDQHRTVLRLSRDRSNRILTVTTNFDTLLERALERPSDVVRPQSFAGQSLPAPGGGDFAGIIHIHGRLIDRTLDLDATPLVLTSADYGDAYMRSGWASRFLFDLARCKTIVLIGYSANDAPVRYFLNVLEADRARFPDLRPVYAFDAYEHDPDEAEAKWCALAVTPVVYSKLNPATCKEDHSLLWGDLKLLAEIVEHPKRSREELARNIFAGDSEALTDKQLRELSWLFTGHSDLWPIVLKEVTDPGWFHILQQQELWSAKDAESVISAWVSQNFEDRLRFTTAVEWNAILGRDFRARLDLRLHQNAPKSLFWQRAWRILLSAGAAQRMNMRGDLSAHTLVGKLKSGLILDGDLTQSVLKLAPVLAAEKPFQFHKDEGETSEEREDSELRLSNLVSLDFSVKDQHAASDIVSVLDTLDDHATRILELGSEALRSSLLQAVDVGMIVDEYDMMEARVPSVEAHGQNDYHDGLLFLVRAIVNAFPKALAENRVLARAQTAQWKTLPGILGVRLLFHVSRDAAAFSADEALELLLELNENDFWTIRRELALLLRDRSADATPALIRAIEARVLASGDVYYSRFLLEEGQVDWRAHARDSKVWLRLKMLDAAGVLSATGRHELNAIVERRPYLDREVEDEDFFGSYSYGVRDIVGDSASIVEANPEDRLQVATDLRKSRDIDRQLGWAAYCQSDATGAFDTLASAELTAPNIPLWNDLLSALSFGQDDTDLPVRDQLAVAAFVRLEELEAKALQTIASSAIDLLKFGPRNKVIHLEDWYDRLWEAVRTTDIEINFDKLFYESAINCAVGRLTEMLLAELKRTRTETGPGGERQRLRLALAAGDDGPAGTVVRAVLVHDIAFVLQVDRGLVEDHLLSRLTAEDDEGRALREILVSHSSITPEVTQVASSEILRGVTEIRPSSHFEERVAASILRPALASVRADDSDGWGILETDVGRVLRLAPPGIRAATLRVLARWMHNDKVASEENWERTVLPFFERVWPRERRFVEPALNNGLMSLAIGAGDLFPEALATLRPYFCPYERGNEGIFPVTQSKVPEQFPSQVLDLLWLIFGPTGETGYDMAETLDRLLAADPSIEVDRRFQSLELRTTRYV
jgi:hypothetical protein